MTEDFADPIPVPDAFSTKPSRFGEKKGPKLHQLPVRLHSHDYNLLKVMLKKDGMSFQKFINFCVRGYMRGDPTMIKAILLERELDLIPGDIQEKHVLSHRERLDIYRELEKGGE